MVRPIAKGASGQWPFDARVAFRIMAEPRESSPSTETLEPIGIAPAREKCI